MESTEGLELKLTAHANEQMKKKNVDLERVQAAFVSPEKLYPNKKYAGQFRVVGNGLCLVGKPQGKEFVVFTIYEDGVMTPPRPDQLNTPEGKAYAELYNRAQRTGKVRRQNEYWPRAHKRASSDIRHTRIK